MMKIAISERFNLFTASLPWGAGSLSGFSVCFEIQGKPGYVHAEHLLLLAVRKL